MSWELDRRGRWRSPEYLAWIRTMPCCCRDLRCPACGDYERSPVVAAHIRYGASIGMGIKPDDFMVIPLTDAIHKQFHNKGHPSLGWQIERLVETVSFAFQRGVLKLDGHSEPVIAF